MTQENAEITTPHNLHDGDREHIKHKCYRPVQIAAKDDCRTSTKDGGLSSYDKTETVFISHKKIMGFSLPCEEMGVKGREGRGYCICVLNSSGDAVEYSASSMHLPQRAGNYPRLERKGANL